MAYSFSKKSFNPVLGTFFHDYGAHADICDV